MILTAILAFLAVAVAAVYVIKVTYNWIRNKIKEKLSKKNAKKVFMTTVEHMVDECDNVKTLDDLDDYDLVMATINDENQVEDLDLIKNTDDELDETVDRLLTSKREVVIMN